MPDLAYSASQAVQTAAGLAMMREFAASPVIRPVMIFFSGADSIKMVGTKQMLMALADVPGHWQRRTGDAQGEAGQGHRPIWRSCASFWRTPNRST